MMYRFAAILLCAAVAFAQTQKPQKPQHPPAKVDAALRARVAEFFQYHVTGEFRKAEALVAEDSKDLFYNRNKPRYLKFNQIERIDYSANFTKAYVTVMVVSPQMIAGWTGGPPTLPIPSYWKLENGKWCWYLPPETFLRTPFGNFPLETVAGGAANAPGQVPPAALGVTPPAKAPQSAPPPASSPGIFPPMAEVPASAPALSPSAPPLPSGADPGALAAIAGAAQLGMSPVSQPQDLVKADRVKVELHPGTPETVTFTNSGETARTLMLLGALSGIDARIDHAEIAGGQQAVLTLQASKDAKGGPLRIMIPQSREMLEIEITVK